MADRPYELLVHTTAPLARNEALYRSLASAYFDFTERASADGTEDESPQQSYVPARHESMTDSNTESQPQHDTLHAFMSPTGAESWAPDSQFEISQKKTYLTRSRLGTSSAAPPASSAATRTSALQAAPQASLPPPSQASFMSTFTSTLDGPLDGMNSPRFRMPSQVGGPAYQWESQSRGQAGSRSFCMGQATQKSASQPESSGVFQAPPSTVPDSMTQGYNPVPAWSTSQVVMESFLSHFQTQSSTSNTTSSPSVRRSQRGVGTMGGLGSSAPRGGQMPPDSQKSASDQSSSMRSSIRPILLENRKEVPQVSPPKPRRQRQASPPNHQPVASNATPASGQASYQQGSARSANDSVSPVPSDEDEQPSATITSPATVRGPQEFAYVLEQHAATPTPLPIASCSRCRAATTATPTSPDTPSRNQRKRRASQTPLLDNTARPSKKSATHASRLQSISEDTRTPANGGEKAAPQVPFTGSFNVPATSHQPRQVRNASFDENVTRISDTPRNASPNGQLPRLKASDGASKPPFPLNTSNQVVPDTPTPAPSPTPAPPQSSTIPPPTLPQSSASTASKSKEKPKRLSTHPITTYEIHPPPPLPGTGHLPTFITPFLTKIANQMSYSRYDPITVLRPLRKDERGYWVFSLPDDVGGWNQEMRRETWDYLEKIIGKGRAGWNVHVYRALWEGTSDGEVNGKGKGKEGEGEKGWKGEEWRVYCWGEIVGQVYLLLFLASSRKIRGLGARWVDGEGKVVVRMGSERRVKACS